MHTAGHDDGKRERDAHQDAFDLAIFCQPGGDQSLENEGCLSYKTELRYFSYTVFVLLCLHVCNLLNAPSLRSLDMALALFVYKADLDKATVHFVGLNRPALLCP